MKKQFLMLAVAFMVICMTLMLSAPALAQNCSSPPTGSYGPAWASQYQSWCVACGGSFSMASGNPRCTPGPNWGRTGGGSPGGAVGGALSQPFYNLGYSIGQSIGKALFGDPAEDQRKQMEAGLRAQEEARAAEIARQQAEAREAIRRAEEEHKRQEQYNRLSSQLQLSDNFDGQKAGGPALMLGDGDDGLRPKGTAFFGMGGGDSAAGSDDSKVVDLRQRQGYSVATAAPPKPADALPLIMGDPNASSPSHVVRTEQDEFDRMNTAWLRKQQELIRQSVAADKRWKNDVLASIKGIRVPSPVFRPKEIKDLRPGDILLITPDDSLTSKAIVRADPFYRAIDYYFGGDVSKPEHKKGPVSHAMTFVKTVNGEMLFLDHTCEGIHTLNKCEGSRILNTKEFLEKYGSRAFYVARPQSKVDGRELWETAKEAALKNDAGYGVRGGNIVCSQRAAIAVAKATELPLQDEHHILSKVLPGIDITPNDFFDSKHAGKFFLISASPILP